MSFTGILIASWLAIAAVAFLALTRWGAGEAELGVLGDTELRLLPGGTGARPATTRLLGHAVAHGVEPFGRHGGGSVHEAHTLDVGGLA